MAIGIRIDKSSLYLPKPFSNRYFTLAPSLSAAIDVGLELVDIEKTIFGEKVTIINVHVWKIGVSPKQFDNQPVDIPGEITDAIAMPPQICAELIWGVESSYPNYKSYRVHWARESMNGLEWANDYLEVLESAASAFSGLSYPLCTKGGTELDVPTMDATIRFRQLNKAWYNRADD